jgi:hypothetical protein
VVDRSQLYAIIDQMKSQVGESTETTPKAAPKHVKATRVAKK